jgi:hypothetical protein
LIDSSLSAEGYAFLTSSSAAETSQESDTIESSYFTHSLVAGLRGAADTIGDRRVTLNEVYRFAYDETLARTETSVYGAQHPSYDMQISGTGDVVLTDIREISASLVFDEQIAGRLSIRDSSDYLIAELTKVSLKPIELGLEPGLYRITLQRGDVFYRAEILLTDGSRTPVALGDFRPISAAPGTARGESPAVDDGTAWADDIRREAEKYADREDTVGEGINDINLQFIPGKNILGGQKETDHILLGLFIATGGNLQGIGTASIGVSNTGYVQGLQVSGVYNRAGTELDGIQGAGIFNTLGGNVKGIQIAGIFNTAGGSLNGIQAAEIFNRTGGNVKGIQIAGIFNAAHGGVDGIQAGLVNMAGEPDDLNDPVPVTTVQAGLVNISRNEHTIPFGIVNIVKNGILHPAVYYDSGHFMNFSFRSGSKYFYSLLSAGTQRITTQDNLLAYRAGFGAELPLKDFFLNLDVSCGSVISIDTLAGASWPARPKGGRHEEHEEAWEQYVRNMDKVYRSGTSFLTELRLIAGYKIFEHLGVFAGLSYTCLYRGSDTSPNPKSAWLGRTWDTGPNSHKIGVFAGLQF